MTAAVLRRHSQLTVQELIARLALSSLFQQNSLPSHRPSLYSPRSSAHSARSLDPSAARLVLEVASICLARLTFRNLPTPAQACGGKSRRKAARVGSQSAQQGRAGHIGFCSFARGRLCQLFSSAALLAYGGHRRIFPKSYAKPVCGGARIELLKCG